jgi:hypothetical protein
MFTKEDKDFDDMAVNPARRRAKISGLSWRRTVIFWCAVVMTIAAIIGSWSGKAGGGQVFAAAFAWSICLKMESDLRLLRVIDRLEKDRDEKSAA